MRLYACGCSFTYGAELLDPSRSAYPVLLGNRLSARVTNDAVNGGSNFRTLYQVTKNVKDNYDLYLIAWSDYARFTFYHSKNNYQINFTPQLANVLYSQESFYKDWGKVLYTHWYNELYAFKIWLQQIIQLQKILENKKYLMLNTAENNLSNWLAPKEHFVNSVKDLINHESMSDDQILDEYEEIQYYISLIDFSKFYQWNEFYIHQLTAEFPIGAGGHILEDGQEHLANLLYQHICSK